MISRRDSTKVTALKPWTARHDVPKRDASGKVDYTLAIRVAADSVRFVVNNGQVAAPPKAGLPTDGTAGVRIGHNLHLAVQPVRITSRPPPNPAARSARGAAGRVAAWRRPDRVARRRGDQ